MPVPPDGAMYRCPGLEAVEKRFVSRGGTGWNSETR
jgi:hypothetical protein